MVNGFGAGQVCSDAGLLTSPAMDDTNSRFDSKLLGFDGRLDPPLNQYVPGSSPWRVLGLFDISQ